MSDEMSFGHVGSDDVSKCKEPNIDFMLHSVRACVHDSFRRLYYFSSRLLIYSQATVRRAHIVDGAQCNVRKTGLRRRTQEELQGRLNNPVDNKRCL